MTFILRWPAILVLFALVLLSAVGALGAAGVISGYEAPVEQVQTAQAEIATTGAADATWLDVGLLAAAALFFLISAIRLIRKTQGFWTWLLGFACYAGLWAYNEGPSLVDRVKALDLTVFRQPQVLLNDPASLQTQIAVLALILIVGVFTFIIDAADRAYWDRQGG
jgi:hypothetical protein